MKQFVKKTRRLLEAMRQQRDLFDSIDSVAEGDDAIGKRETIVRVHCRVISAWDQYRAARDNVRVASVNGVKRVFRLNRRVTAMMRRSCEAADRLVERCGLSDEGQD
jgi:hypothetical protein